MKENQAKKAVLFDFDGTIADTNQLIINSWQYTFRKVFGQNGDEKEIIKTFGEPLTTSMKNLFPGRNTDEMIAIYREYQYDNFDRDIDIFPGMRELVMKLKTSGYKTAIVTSRLKHTTLHGLELFGIRDYFDEIVTVEDCSEHKPMPGPALTALEKLGVKPEESIMVGDSKFDVICANRAGITSVLVDWAVAGEISTADGADSDEGIAAYRISKPMELMEIIGK